MWPNHRNISKFSRFMICCVNFWKMKALHKTILLTRGNEVIALTIYLRTGNICATFEVLTAVVMKSSVFWDITPCSPFNGLIWRYIPEDRTLRNI
jgi:hypothetical protein